MPKFLSKDRASVMTEQQKFEYRCKDTIFESDALRESRQNPLNEDGHDPGPWVAREISPGNGDLFDFIKKLISTILGALGAVIGAGALAIAKAIAIKKLKNSMIKFVDWTEYGWHGKRGKKYGIRYWRSEADKDRESYFSHERSAERDMLKITQQLMKHSGLIDLQP